MSVKTARCGPGTRRSEVWSSAETAGDVLTYMCDHAAAGGQVDVSNRQIGDAIGVGINTAKRALRRLSDTGRIELVRIGTGRDYPSRYRVVDGDRAAVAA